MRYRFSFAIRLPIDIDRVRFVSSRTFSLNRETVCGARRIVAFLFVRKLNSRNLRFHGRSTALLSRFTFSFNFPSTNWVTDAMTRCPTRLLATKCCSHPHNGRSASLVLSALCPGHPAGCSREGGLTSHLDGRRLPAPFRTFTVEMTSMLGAHKKEG